MLQRKQPNQPVLAKDYNSLVDLINKPKIIGDTKTIKIKNIAGTTVISAINQPMAIGGSSEGGDVYNGYFKVINISDENNQKIKVVDGYNQTSSKAGRIQINNYMIDVDIKEFSITETCMLIIEATTINDPATNATAELKIVNSINYIENLGQMLLARIRFENEKITLITKEQFSLFVPVIGVRL